MTQELRANRRQRLSRSLRLWPWAALLVGFTNLARAASEPDAEPTLTLQTTGEKIVFKRSELLERPDLEPVDVPADPSYPGRTMHYQAVRLSQLFAAAKPDPAKGETMLQYRCRDGFSAPIAVKRLLSEDPKGAQAYVAIEPPQKPWPAVKPQGPSAGPFYLIWKNPQASQIGPEEWPFQLVSFTVQADLHQLYPAIVPGADAAAPVQHGFAHFTKNCLPCHTVNRSGPAELGPDLNVPYNPTEYFSKKALRRLIRNPQDLRYFPQSRMSAFAKSVLPDKDLTELIAYLTYMAKHKVAAPAADHP